MSESPFVYVRLERWQVNYCREEAQRREDEARLYKMRNGTTATVGLPAHEADLVGTLCELAVSVHTGLSERFFERYDPHAADVCRTLRLRLCRIAPSPKQPASSGINGQLWTCPFVLFPSLMPTELRAAPSPK